MNEKPILFQGDMVRAILEGRKTETRRIVKPQPKSHHWDILPGYKFIKQMMNTSGGLCVKFIHALKNRQDDPLWVKSPYGQVGDRLWVRETFAVYGDDEQYVIHYKATHQNEGSGWTPSIFMKRIYSRITLEITEIKVERVQGITSQEAWKEGVKCKCQLSEPSEDCRWNINSFHELWDSINKKRGFPWDSNPWVWVIKFKEIKP